MVWILSTTIPFPITERLFFCKTSEDRINNSNATTIRILLRIATKFTLVHAIIITSHIKHTRTIHLSKEKSTVFWSNSNVTINCFSQTTINTYKMKGLSKTFYPQGILLANLNQAPNPRYPVKLKKQEEVRVNSWNKKAHHMMENKKKSEWFGETKDDLQDLEKKQKLPW